MLSAGDEDHIVAVREQAGPDHPADRARPVDDEPRGRRDAVQPLEA